MTFLPESLDLIPFSCEFRGMADRVLPASDGRDRNDRERTTPRHMQAGRRLHQRRQVLLVIYSMPMPSALWWS